MYKKEDQLQIQKAIHFLTSNFEKTGHNHGKPVVLHSINVAMYLYHRDYPTKVVISALLHDLLEDTEVKKLDIENAFDKEVADLVEVLSFDSNIEDYVERYKEHFKRIEEYGKDALIVKAVDIMENAKYYILAEESLRPKLYQKLDDFIELAKPHLDGTKLYEDLKTSALDS